jgi:hypothetical protein
MATVERPQTVSVDDVETSGLLQVYSTIVYGRRVPPAEFVTIPDAALEPDLRNGLYDFVEGLELDVASAPIYAGDLSGALWHCLTEGGSTPSSAREEWSDEEVAMFTFCEYLAYAPIIPFAMSPLESKGLGGMMASGAALGAGLAGAATGAKVGVGTGIIVGTPGGPLVFIAVPAGFIVGGLVGAVTGVMAQRIASRLAPR